MFGIHQKQTIADSWIEQVEKVQINWQNFSDEKRNVTHTHLINWFYCDLRQEVMNQNRGNNALQNFLKEDISFRNDFVKICINMKKMLPWVSALH